MKLKRARVTNFKSVLDSGWFSLDQVTCLVGKNESGKTAILEALEKLNSVRLERGALKDTEYPRMNWSEYEESDSVDVAVTSEWEISNEERRRLLEIVGDESLLSGSIVTLKKSFDNSFEWIFPFDVTAVAKKAIADSSLTSSEKEDLSGIELTDKLLKALTNLPDPSQRQTALLADLKTRWPEGGAFATARVYLLGRLPGFVYYSQYDNLPGRVSLDQLMSAQQQGILSSIAGSEVFLALLSMVGTTPEELSAISTSEQLISQLESVQSRISRRIFKYWSQNKHLKVRFRFDAASPADPPPFNVGKIFQTRIENTRHDVTIRLDERSTGFVWFFSFLVWFSEVQKQYGENLVVLLDEPGLSLHARAQADLLRYFAEELEPKYQVVYTTHSPFMIDSSKLTTSRTVEDKTGPDDEVLGTKVSDQALSTDRDTLFPLQAALGYDITQTLFIGENSLLVEGPSDLLYLQWASDELHQASLPGLDERWTVTPCGGITKIPSFLALFGGNRLHVAVLTDLSDGDRRKVRDLRESDLLRDNHVFTANSFSEVNDASEGDVEDILGWPLYSSLVNDAYELKGKQKLPSERPEGGRILKIVEDHFKTLPAAVPEFDHYAPSRFLVTNPSKYAEAVTKPAIERFALLFSNLNDLL